ncbi:group II intron reverse transcriptase/maturase [Streptomyces sp. NPDC058583]|uniref:group II intron reverse transcriptase/maturase n=1 Tax=unclassified Streptomyces TaxID=2593676 RepID=UPI0036626439
MAKGASESAVEVLECQEASVNTDELEWALMKAERRVLEIQTKLHRWASDDPRRGFSDLFNLVHDPAFLLVAWDRVRGNKGAKTAGVDGRSAYSIEARMGVEEFLDRLRIQVKDRSFRPLPVRERMIPKANGKLRRLGIPTVADRVVQASLKLVLEPIFEADFDSCSYGFRPNRRAHDAVFEVRHLAANSYEWVLEADIAACFDEISHTALMDRVRARIEDKRVLSLVRAFLKAGILTESGALQDTNKGTPQGGILSPLLANVALTALDEHFAEQRSDRIERARRRRHGLANVRLIRYADDFVIMVSGTNAHTEALLDEVAGVLSGLGLRFAPDKTRVLHIDEGLDFLGWRIQRHHKRGTSKQYVYTYPAKKAVRSCAAKVKAICWQDVNLPLEVLLHRLNSLVRGWTTYFRPGVSHAAFRYLRAVVWRQVFGWMRRKHRRATWKELRRRYCGGGWWPAGDGTILLDPAKVRTTRYRYRGATIPTPWPSTA